MSAENRKKKLEELAAKRRAAEESNEGDNDKLRFFYSCFVLQSGNSNVRDLCYVSL